MNSTKRHDRWHTLSTYLILFTTGVVSIAAISEADAGLVLTIDTTTQTAFLSGTDTGTPSGFSFITWLAGSGGTASQASNNAVVTSSSSSVTVGQLFASDTDRVGVQFFMSNMSMTTLTSVPSEIFDYSSFTAAQQATLEGTIGTSIPLLNGSGFMSLNSVAAVPEPSSIGMFGLGVGIAFVRRRRKRRLTAA